MPEDLQFDRAESSDGADKTATCSICQRPMTGSYFAAGERTFCPDCKARIETELRTNRGNLPRAILFGVAWQRIDRDRRLAYTLTPMPAPAGGGASAGTGGGPAVSPHDIECHIEEIAYCEGRRHAAVRGRAVGRGPDEVAAWLTRAAQCEASSARTFALLASELRALRLPVEG